MDFLDRFEEEELATKLDLDSTMSYSCWPEGFWWKEDLYNNCDA